MMTTPLVRVPLTLATALAFHVSMSPPTCPAPSTRDRHARICATARLITAMATKGLYWASAIADTFVLLVPHVPTALRPFAIPPRESFFSWIMALGQGLDLRTLSPLSLPPVRLATIVGTTLALTGALLRYTAYHALGRFYVCPNLGEGPCLGPSGWRSRGAHHAHALITSGPYAFVRHPGYAGLLLSTMGLVVLHFDVLSRLGDGSYVGQSPWSAGMRTVALVCALLGTMGALRRIRDEEQGLRARFKREWEAWAEKVRYRVVPGVY